jgi:hypothetical protein
VKDLLARKFLLCGTTLPVESKVKLSSTLAGILDFQSAYDSQFRRGQRKILTLVQKTKQKEEEEKKSIYQTGAGDRIELLICSLTLDPIRIWFKDLVRINKKGRDKVYEIPTRT